MAGLLAIEIEITGSIGLVSGIILVTPVGETKFEGVLPARKTHALVDRVACLRSQPIAGEPHGEGCPGAAAKTDLRESTEVVRQSGDSERLVPALPHAGVGEWVDVPIDAYSEVVEQLGAEDVVMVQPPGLAGNSLELKAFQNVWFGGKAGHRVGSEPPAAIVDEPECRIKPNV